MWPHIERRTHTRRAEDREWNERMMVRAEKARAKREKCRAASLAMWAKKKGIPLTPPKEVVPRPDTSLPMHLLRRAPERGVINHALRKASA